MSEILPLIALVVLWLPAAFLIAHLFRRIEGQPPQSGGAGISNQEPLSNRLSHRDRLE